MSSGLFVAGARRKINVLEAAALGHQPGLFHSAIAPVETEMAESHSSFVCVGSDPLVQLDIELVGLGHQQRRITV